MCRVLLSAVHTLCQTTGKAAACQSIVVCHGDRGEGKHNVQNPGQKIPKCQDLLVQVCMVG